MTYPKFNFKIHCLPPCEREIWHCQKTNADQTKEAIEQLSWDSSFKYLDFKEIIFYLTEPSKKFFQTTFCMKLLSVMTEIHLGLIIESRN